MAIEAQWQSLLDQKESEEKQILAQGQFLEQIVTAQPRFVLEQSSKLISASQDIGYKLGEAYGVSMEGYSHYMLSNYDKALPLLKQALAIFKSLGIPTLESKVVGAIASVYTSLGEFSKSIEYGQRTLKLVQEFGDREQEGWVMHGFGLGTEEMGQLELALEYYEKSLSVFEAIGHKRGKARALVGIGSICFKRKEFDRAKEKNEKSLALFKADQNRIGEARSLNDLGAVALEQGNPTEALRLHTDSLNIRKEIGNRQAVSTSLHNLGKVYVALGNQEQALQCLNEALHIATEVKARTRIFQIYETLAEAYEKAGDFEQALLHYRSYNKVRDEVFTEDLNTRIAHLESAFEIDRAEKEAEIAQLKNVELKSKNQQLEKLLADLKAAQTQLVQSEKLASLGNLTAGIAHELKNPLNFVNNFSALSIEIMEELDELLDGQQPNGETVDSEEFVELIDTLRFNTRKVNEHGIRADRIVRSMVEHARGQSGEKQSVSINELLRDYTKLAYHGMRASDREFKVKLQEDFYEEDLKLKVVSQDLGRVFLNILNNAFYTTREKKNAGIAGYEPCVKISTIRHADHFSIQIADNGEGISAEKQSKIFEPFYTSKPTGSGTGLGLFLSYEIVVQGHNGELLVESETGQGSTFIINLPLTATG